MTRIHLLRHAHAGDPGEWDGSDAARPLSSRGREQAELLGRFLAKRGFRADRVLTSPKVRAAQTAEIVAEHLSLPVVVEERLGGGLDVDALEAILRAHDDPERPVLVGHDPDFSELAEALSGAGSLPMRKGAMLRIDVDRPLAAGRGTLRWLVPPDLLRTDA